MFLHDMIELSCMVLSEQTKVTRTTFGNLSKKIRHGKGKVTRTADIPESLVKRVDRFVKLYRRDAKPDEPLLVSTRGKRMIYRTIYEKMKKRTDVKTCPAKKRI